MYLEELIHCVRRNDREDNESSSLRCFVSSIEKCFVIFHLLSAVLNRFYRQGNTSFTRDL